jgi:hypothetical protein
VARLVVFVGYVLVGAFDHARDPNRIIRFDLEHDPTTEIVSACRPLDALPTNSPPGLLNFAEESPLIMLLSLQERPSRTFRTDS